MLTLNKVFLVGNLTRDPELRYTPQGTPVATLRIAANTIFKDKNGQPQKDTCFVNVVVWRQMAETCNQYLQKGKQIFVEGRLQYRSWQDNEGRSRSVIEVRANRVQFISAPIKDEVEPIDLGEPPPPPEALEEENISEAVEDAH